MGHLRWQTLPVDRVDGHSCHILPFQPILWDKYFPSEPVKTAQNSPKSISEGGRIWRVWWSWWCDTSSANECAKSAFQQLQFGRGDDTVGNLIELKFLNASFSSSGCSNRAFRAYPLVEIRQTAPCRSIRGNSSDSSRQYLSQQYPPPPLTNARAPDQRGCSAAVSQRRATASAAQAQAPGCESGGGIWTYMCLDTYLHTYLSSYLPTYLPISLSTYLPIYLPTFSTCLSTYLPRE